MRTSTLLLAALISASCGLPERPDLARRTDAIVGGQLAHDESAVFVVSSRFTCSGVLIAPRSVLTSAQCLDSFGSATNAATPAEQTGANFYDISATSVHPLYDPRTGEANLGIAYLNRASDATPVPWNTIDLTSALPTAVRVTGFGSSGPTAQDYGTRRTAGVTISSFTGDNFTFGKADAGTCFGDYGAPVIVTLPGGAELVGGVTRGPLTDQCGESDATRVDLYTDFIRQWVRTNEPPTCSRDDRCKPDCTPVDPDCDCLADGICSAQCLDLDDPDCPEHCKTDGVCSTVACPRRDADCVPDGAPCPSSQNADHCVGRLCTTDPQHPVPFCSRVCTGPNDCESPMICGVNVPQCIHPQLPRVERGVKCTPGVNWCGPDLVCEAVSSTDAAICLQTCTMTSQCLRSTEKCVLLDSGRRGCVTPTPVQLERADTVPLRRARVGCGATSTTPWVLLAATGLLFRRRRLLTAPADLRRQPR